MKCRNIGWLSSLWGFWAKIAESPIILLQYVFEVLVKFLPITVCDGIINLQINKSVCDFCHIFLLDKWCSSQFCMVYQKYQIYIYCIHLLMSLFTIQLRGIIGKNLPSLWQRHLEKPLLLNVLINTSGLLILHILL